jgi:hypothetical protein
VLRVGESKRAPFTAADDDDADERDDAMVDIDPVAGAGLSAHELANAAELRPALAFPVPN